MDTERNTRASSKTSWNPQDRGRSLVSMRTFYAFGARSTSIGPGARSASVVPSLPAHYNPPGYSHRSVRASVAPSSATPFTRNAPLRATISYVRPPPSVSYRSSYTPSAARSPSFSRFTTPTRAYSPIERARPASRHVASPVRSPERRPAMREEASSRAPSATDDSHASRPPSSAYEPAKTPAPTVDEKALVELEELRSRHRSLEEELARMQLLLKDGERSNRELKRRLLESEAETKVWRAKAEHAAQPQIIEVVRPAKAPEVIVHHHSIDDTLYDKLEMTADKMAKLNAMTDLKMLQSHIESALTEITSK